MKILLLNPPDKKNRQFIREGRCMQTKSSWAALWMPLSLTYLTSILKEEGDKIKLIDFTAEKKNFNDLEKMVKNFSPDLTVINTGFPSIESDLESAKLIKKNLPRSKIAVFGMFPTLLWKFCLKKNPAINFCIVGEPEWSIKNLAKSLKENLPLENIKGLAFRRRGKIHFNGLQKFKNNELDRLPFPARQLLNRESYKLPILNQPFTLISIGRGCPFNCSYCIANIYYGKIFRKRKIESIIRELQYCVEKLGIKNFLFWGESFTLDQAYGEKICDAILNKNLKITWSTTSRVDTLNLRLLKKMKKAGCKMLGLGIESTNDKILENIQKGTNFEKIKKAVEMVKKSGIKSMGHFIFGLPGETKETAKETVDYALKSGIDYAQFYCAIPYPGTKLGNYAQKKGWVEPSPWINYDLTKSIMRNETLSSQEIKKIRDKAYRKFYFRPKIFFGAAREATSFRAFYLITGFLKWIITGKKKPN